MIYTIGTSNRTIVEFQRELEKRRITHLVDVRSSPWSRHTHFNRPQIAAWAERGGIYYRHAGDILGGRSKVPLDSPRYIDELNRLLEASCRETVAVFCAEGDPEFCHRSYSVAASLLVRFGVIATNVRRDGCDQDVTETLARTFSGSIPICIRSDVFAALTTARLNAPSMPHKSPLS